MSNGKYTGAMDVGAGVHLRRAPAAATAARVDPQPDHLAAVPVRRRPRPEARHVETYTAGARRGDAGASDDDGSPRNADADVATPSARETAREAWTARRHALDLFFNVIGTPSWRDIDAIPNLRWRQLRGVRAARGEHHQAVCGLRRKLARPVAPHAGVLDRRGRATSPREILAHEYFREEEASVSGAAAERRAVPRDMSVGGFDRVGSAMAVDGAAETRTEEMKDADGPTTFEMEAEDDDAGDERRRFWELSVASRCARRAGDGVRGRRLRVVLRRSERVARALPGVVRARVRAAHAGSSAAAPEAFSADDGDGTRSFPVLGTRDGPGDAMEASFGSFEDPSVPGRLTRAFPLFFRGGEKPVAYAGTDGVGTRDDFESSPTPSLSVDFEQRYLGGAFGTTGVFGQGGVGESSARDFGALGDARSPVAGSPSNRNARRFASLGALGHLGANRHGEWGEEDLPSAMKRLEGLSGVEAWGVTAVPPGMNQKEGDLYRSMSNQQGR